MTEHPDHLYVIGEGGGGVVKIGRSFSPRERVGSVQVGNPRRVQLLLVVPEAGKYESAMHRKFSGRHLGGEWFNFCEDDPVEAVQRALDEILHPTPKPRAVYPPKAKVPTGTYRRNPCEEAGCRTAMDPILDAGLRWFLDNHPDPAAYLLEQGFAWHCIEETLGHVLPDNRKAALWAVQAKAS
jgi:hypothetical protein